ncbi:MAG TPA: hypothetical protein DEP66_05375 [Acidimicrobiaceae bacterium]|nr:hypothetical protein [Acidimicrobiaceae bacterium]HCB37624.1 hypothetical protein [Acidimicrobiaceae bacterium]
MTAPVAGALAVVSWDPVLTGYLAVVAAVGMLCGAVYLLLATNLGARLGFLVAWTGLWGWILLMAAVWWVFGIGWKGTDPGWEVTHVTANPASVPVAEVQQLAAVGPQQDPPGDWDVAVDAEALSAASGHIVCTAADPRRLEAVNSCLFTAATDYHVYRVVTTGGERYRPLGIPDNALTQYFLPSRSRDHFAVVQLQPFSPVRQIDPNLLDDDGAVVLPVSRVDASAPVYSVVMVRDMGNVRLRPALLTVFAALVFGLGCYHLHRRDQAIWAVRAAVAE